MMSFSGGNTELTYTTRIMRSVNRLSKSKTGLDSSNNASVTLEIFVPPVLRPNKKCFVIGKYLLIPRNIWRPPRKSRLT